LYIVDIVTGHCDRKVSLPGNTKLGQPSAGKEYHQQHKIYGNIFPFSQMVHDG
jgi:hypothetical protein